MGCVYVYIHMHMAHDLIVRDMVARYDVDELQFVVFMYMNMAMAYLEFDRLCEKIFIN